LVGLSRISTAINHQKGVEDEAGIAHMIESKKHPQAADDTRADLAERAADQREEKRKKEEAKCLEILRTSDYLTDRERIQERVLGTCNWFLRHPIYQKWRGDEASGLLWLTADPGCGKSALSRFLIDIRRVQSRICLIHQHMLLFL
jgi:hypothetical protein